MILQFSSRRQILRKAPGRSILRREVARETRMQFDQLKWREAIPLLCGGATPSQPRTSAARQNVAAGSPHRRELLQSLLAAALATVPGWHNDAVAGTLPLERDRFVELSQKLCAMSIDDRAMADAIKNALADQYSDYDLRRLVELL